jgi:hypothetical protein
VEKGVLDMEEKKMTRREAMARLTKVIAMAAGLSTMQVGRLFGQVKKPNLQKLASIKTSNRAVKLLKVLIHKNRSLFESEYGRITPQYTVKDVKAIPDTYLNFIKEVGVKDIRPGMVVCPNDWMGPDMTSICGTHVFGAGYGKVSEYCDEDSGCTESLSCNEHDCGIAYCTGHLTCGTGYSCDDVEISGAFTGSFFDQYQNDPYVQALFREFNVTSSKALAQEVRTMFIPRP